MNFIGWKDHLINLIVVILGISIAFYLENWRETKKQKKVEQQYLEALTNDLEQDLALLDTLIRIDENRLGMLVELTSASIGASDKLDSLAIYLGYIQFHVPFEPQQATYEAMTSSGTIDIISDFEMRGSIVELYSQWYRGIRQFDDALVDHTNRFIRPFVIYEVEYTSASAVNPEFLQKQAFRNMIFSYRYLFEARLDYHKQVKEALVKLIDRLNRK